MSHLSAGYLEAFTRPNVSLVTDRISRITSTGIETDAGEHHTLDAIICATGFDVSHRPPFPLIGRNNTSLADEWKDEPMSYLSLCVSNFPNFFTFSGPNAPVGHGSLMAGLGWSADYMCQWIQKIAEEDIKCVDVKGEVSEEFNTYSDEIMQRLAWSGGCQSVSSGIPCWSRHDFPVLTCCSGTRIIGLTAESPRYGQGACSATTI